MFKNTIFSLDLVTFFLFCFVTIKPSIFKLTFLIIRVCYQKRQPYISIVPVSLVSCRLIISLSFPLPLNFVDAPPKSTFFFCFFLSRKGNNINLSCASAGKELHLVLSSKFCKTRKGKTMNCYGQQKKLLQIRLKGGPFMLVMDGVCMLHEQSITEEWQ